MAGYRQIYTQIWKDEFFIELEPREKLLFIYLFSNDLASISGLYKIPTQIIVNETGLDRQFIENAIDKFKKLGRVDYEKGVIYIKNMTKYHSITSPTTAKKVSKDVQMIDDCPLKAKYYADNPEVDTLSIPYRYPIDTHLLKPKPKDKSKPKPIGGVGDDSDTPLIIDDENGISTGELEPLATAFRESTGIPDFRPNPRNYIESLEKMHSLGVTGEDIQSAVRIMRDKNLCIVGPKSVINIAAGELARRKTAIRSASELFTAPVGVEQ